MFERVMKIQQETSSKLISDMFNGMRENQNNATKTDDKNTNLEVKINNFKPINPPEWNKIMSHETIIVQ